MHKKLKNPAARLIKKKELRKLRQEIETSKIAILSASNHFEHAVDPTLIECCIYELNAAELRYQFLLRTLKKRESQEEII